jgi:hypothetical protein
VDGCGSTHTHPSFPAAGLVFARTIRLYVNWSAIVGGRTFFVSPTLCFRWSVSPIRFTTTAGRQDRK